MLPRLSIIISTYRHEKLLKLTLESLLEQTAAFSQFEVIVVDYDARPYLPTQALCVSSHFRALTLKVVHHPVLRVGEALNCGIRYASAPLVGFLDDDAKLAPYWVERALDIFGNMSPDIFGGPIHPYYTTSKPAWVKDEYLVLSYGTSKIWLSEGRYLFAGNLFIQRTWLDRLTGFTPNLGRKVGSKDCGEEMDLQMRAYRMGARIFYDPDLYILHCALPEHLTPGWYLRTPWQVSKAQAKIAALNPLAPARRSWAVLLINIIRDGWRIAACYVGLPLRSRKVFPFASSYLIEKVAPAVSAFAANWFAFVYSLRKPTLRG